MRTQYQFIEFVQLPPPTRPKRTTELWECRCLGGNILGKIEWKNTWRQYCFSPEDGTVFSRGCMEDLNDFISQLTKARKK